MSDQKSSDTKIFLNQQCLFYSCTQKMDEVPRKQYVGSEDFLHLSTVLVMSFSVMSGRNKVNGAQTCNIKFTHDKAIIEGIER